MIVRVELEEWKGSAVVRTCGSDYARQPAAAFSDKPAKLTERQAVFYRNLIRLAEAVASDQIPLDFEIPNGGRLYLDRGCVKIAEHAGFILPLEDGPDGVVDVLTLAWNVS